MAPRNNIVALIFIITLVAISSATRNRIVPEENILPGHGTFTAEGLTGVIFPNQINYVVLFRVVTELPRRFRKLHYKKIFETAHSETIAQVRIEDLEDERRTPGGRIELIKNGPGFKNVTLNFVSERNVGIYKYVTLYGH